MIISGRVKTYVYPLMLEQQLHCKEAFAAFMEITLVLFVCYSVVINTLLSLRHYYSLIFPVRFAFILFILVMQVDQSDYKFLVVYLFEPFIFVAGHIHLLIIGFLEYLYSHVTSYV